MNHSGRSHRLVFENRTPVQNDAGGGPSPMRRAFAAVLGLLMLVARVPPSVAAEPAPYEIPVIISLTGGGAFLGQEEQDSLRIAEKTFNKDGGIHGRPIRFVFLDD